MGLPVSIRCGLTTLVLIGLSPLATAHHSRAEYSNEAQDMEGEFVRVTWTNPHPTFTFKIFAGDGTEELVELQAWGSPYTLQRAGVGGERFKAGERVRIAARASTRRENQFVLTHTLFPDGTEVVLNLNEAPRWTENSVGDRDDYLASDDDVISDAAHENRGIFRVWSTPAQPDETFLTEFVLTEAADPRTRAPSPLGYSAAHWEDDVLVVHTTRIDFPFYDLGGTPLSDQAEVVERFSLREDQTRLDYVAITTDPETFVGAATNRRHWLALGDTVLAPHYERDCEPVG